MQPIQTYQYHTVYDLVHNHDDPAHRFKGLRILANHVQILHSDEEKKELFDAWREELISSISTASFLHSQDQQLAKLILIELATINEVCYS